LRALQQGVAAGLGRSATTQRHTPSSGLSKSLGD
jgi:hypothetical protein